MKFRSVHGTSIVRNGTIRHDQTYRRFKFGVPKHSNFEPDYFLAKGNGKPTQNAPNISGLHLVIVNRDRRDYAMIDSNHGEE